MKIKVINRARYQMPSCSTPLSTGMDLRAGIDEDIVKGILNLNSPGTIDADYRQEVCVNLINLSEENFVIKDGECIYQMLIVKQEKAEWVTVENFVDARSGTIGYGHTGKALK
jgi:dUTP pyrophosphatase